MMQQDISIPEENALTIVDDAPHLPALTDREAAFVAAYIGPARMIRSEAARMIGANSAKEIGYQLYHRPRVQAHIKAHLDEAAINGDRILANVAAIANADWGDVTEVRTRNGQVVEARVDLLSVLRANELLGKEVGKFREKVEVDVAFVPKRIIGVDIAAVAGKKQKSDPDE